VGQLATAYRSYMGRRNVLMLLETLSVREASEADDKYSAAVSCVYPMSIANLLLGSYILSAKNATHNRYVLFFYYIPTAVGSFVVFFAGSLILLPFCYMKIVAHKFALVVKNPQGAGAKATSDRFGFAVFFMFLGPFILLLNSITDCYWFVLHLYKLDLDVVAKQKQEERGFGITHGISRITFKKMLQYFNFNTGADFSKIALCKDVSQDVRGFLDVEAGINELIFGSDSNKSQTKGGPKRNPQSEFDNIQQMSDKKDVDASRLDNT
jgi:hypothetical protein